MLDQLVKRIVDRYPGVGQFRAILALRGDDPFAPHELARMIVRESSFAERLEASYRRAASKKPRRRPFTARDMMDHWGYRAVHCSTVGNAVSDILGPAFRGRDHAPFWRWTFVYAGYTAIICEVLRVHEDEAFPGAFLRNTALLLFRAYEPDVARETRRHATAGAMLPWDAEREMLGWSHLDLGRRLVKHWRLPESLLPAFEAEGEPESLSGLIVRSLAAAQRHGFSDPLGPAVPARLVPEREPILDAYYRRHGGSDGVYAEFRGMLATARIQPEASTIAGAAA